MNTENTEIYIIAGFLGAGKTTLIQKLLKEAFQGSKVALVENDFGEINVDAALLKSGGVEVAEISSGCVCCTLQGDFVLALRELIKRLGPDKILIEPSGVSKLSDVAGACLDPDISAAAHVAGKITVVDVKRCRMYLDNFGEFFEDQIRSADTVVLARTQLYPDKTGAARELIRGLNERAVIISEPWEQINARDLLYPGEDREPAHGHTPARERDHGSHADHTREDRHANHTRAHGHADHSPEGAPARERDHGSHAGAGGHAHTHGHAGHAHETSHNHAAEDIFDAVTITTKRVFALEDLKTRVAQMERDTGGAVIRAKGVLRGKDGYWNLQYIPGDLRIESCPAEGGALCVIGRNLNGSELAELFGGAV
jgi:G3E family GTPase